MTQSKPKAARLITDPGPEYASAARLWQGIPGLERAANGRLWAVWYTGGEGEGIGNYVVLHTSADDGVTWSGPEYAAMMLASRSCDGRLQDGLPTA